MPDGALVSSYLQGAGGTVGMLGGLDDKPAEIKANGGAAPVTFPYSSYRREPGRLLHRRARKEMVAKNPDLVKRFVQATIKSYKATEANPDAAIAAMADIVGGTMDEDEGKAQARAVLECDAQHALFGRRTRTRRSACNVPSDWDDMVTLMKKYNDLQTDKAERRAFYTNDFVK